MTEEQQAARREYLKQWRKDNRDHINEYSRKWRAENRDKVAAINNRYWQRKANETKEAASVDK